MAAELSETARSRRSAILLVTGALGYILTFALIAQIEREPDTWVAAAFGIIPLAIGIGYFPGRDADPPRHHRRAINAAAAPRENRDSSAHARTL